MNIDNNFQPIGVFDSGVGGLTVLKEIIHKLPHEHIVYLGDTARVPYGPKDLNDVRDFVVQICAFFQNLGTKLIVIACNTGTAAGLDIARQIFDIPVIGVIEPGVKLALERTKNGKIGVIGTVGTINSQTYEKTLRGFDNSIAYHSLACPNFVGYVEDGVVHGAEIFDEIDNQLKPLKQAGIDTLILGCTHYPLLEHIINEVMGDKINIISSAEATAIEVERILGSNITAGTIDDIPGKNKIKYFSTADPESFKEIGSRFLGREIPGVELAELSDLTEMGLQYSRKEII